MHVAEFVGQSDRLLGQTIAGQQPPSIRRSADIDMTRAGKCLRIFAHAAAAAIEIKSAVEKILEPGAVPVRLRRTVDINPFIAFEITRIAHTVRVI